jgi:uncharacterized iron-regulated membrane protein
MTRRLLVLLHRYVGLATAAFLLIIGITGAMLAYLHPLSVLLSPELYNAPGRGVVLAPAQLIERAQAAEPRAQFDAIPLALEAGAGVNFNVRGKPDPASGKPFDLGYDQLWLDPVTGSVLGRVDSEAIPPTRASLMNFVYRLHYSLAMPGRWGVWIVGGVAILWFFDCFVGAVLTLPRGRPFLRKWQLAWGIQRKRLNYDLHRAGGLWPWLLLATLALSGIYFNLGREVFMPLFGLVAETTQDPFEMRPMLAPDAIQPPAVDMQQAIDIAAVKAAELGWTAKPASIFHRAEQGFWQVYYDKPKSQWATAGNYGLFIDDHSGAVFFVRAPGGTRGDVFLDWLAALHTGGVFGTPYKLILCALGLVIATLSITGVVIWARKRGLIGRQRGKRQTFQRGAISSRSITGFPTHKPRT